MKYELRKTHYEQVMEFFKTREQGQLLQHLATVTAEEGLDDMTFDQFSDIILRIPREASPAMRPQLAFEANVFFHLFMMNRHGEKIYYITPGLATRLAATEPSLDSHFLKSPFREVYFQIDPGLFSIKDIDGSKHPVHGFYVNFEEGPKAKEMRIMVSSVLQPVPGIPFNDSVFFFRVVFESGRIDQLIREYALKPRPQEQLEAMGGARNIDNMEEFAMFVANALLYVTSQGADLTTQSPEPVNKAPKSTAKQRKLAQRLARQTSYRVIIAGGNITNHYSDVEDLRAAGSITAWKLNKRVRVRAYWRGQWFGSEKDGSKHQRQIWVEEYEKGPQFAETLNKTIVVK